MKVWGLRWGDMELRQISGSGRVMLRQGKPNGGMREWWARPPKARAEVFETSDMTLHTFGTREVAEQVAANLAPH